MGGWVSCQGCPTLWAQVMDCLCCLLWSVEHFLDEWVIRWNGCLEWELQRGWCIGGDVVLIWLFVLLKNGEGVVTPHVALVDGPHKVKHFWCCTVAGRWAQHPCISCRSHPWFWGNDNPQSKHPRSWRSHPWFWRNQHPWICRAEMQPWAEDFLEFLDGFVLEDGFRCGGGDGGA
jgi:hypothetical protein